MLFCVLTMSGRVSDSGSEPTVAADTCSSPSGVGADGALATGQQGDRHQQNTRKQEEKRDSALSQLVRQALLNRLSHIEVKVGPLSAQVRVSRVARRNRVSLNGEPLNFNLDLDIIQIVVNGKRHRRKGLATSFFNSLRRVAALFQRGVYLENCLTDDSRAWADYLVVKGLMLPYHACPDSFCFLSPLTS